MKTILPAIALVAGLAGCGQTPKDPALQELDARKEQIINTLTCNRAKEVLISGSPEISKKINTSEVVIGILQYSPAVLGVTERLGEKFIPIDSWKGNTFNYTETVSEKYGKILGILDGNRISGCRFKGDETTPIFLHNVPDPSEVLAQRLNGDNFGNYYKTTRRK